jgi:hypothetical protein
MSSRDVLIRPPLRDRCYLVIDESGVGRAVGDMFTDAGLRAVRVAITAGVDAVKQDQLRWSVAKSLLISGVDARLHSGELRFAADLGEAHALAALTGLIEAARDRAFGASHKIEVIFYGPEPKVGIEIELWAGPGRGYVEEAVYLLPNRPEGIEAVEKASAFEVTVKIDQQPIYAIADLFRYDGCDEQGYPLEPNHPWNQEGSPEDQLKRRAEIEQYVNERAKQ